MDKIKLYNHSGITTLEAKQFLPISLETAWEFFSTPKNLANITPDYMNFRITSEEVENMYEGKIVTYKVNPFPYVRLNWVTEITKIVDHKMFIDEQRFGPYAMWHHEHWFEKQPTGVLMTDKLSYKLPLWNRFANSFVRQQVRKIFEYRFEELEMIFPGKETMAA